MGDIVEKLEDRERHPSTLALREDAAQEIRRLRDEMLRLRAALKVAEEALDETSIRHRD